MRTTIAITRPPPPFARRARAARTRGSAEHQCRRRPPGLAVSRLRSNRPRTTGSGRSGCPPRASGRRGARSQRSSRRRRRDRRRRRCRRSRASSRASPAGTAPRIGVPEARYSYVLPGMIRARSPGASSCIGMNRRSAERSSSIVLVVRQVAVAEDEVGKRGSVRLGERAHELDPNAPAELWAPLEQQLDRLDEVDVRARSTCRGLRRLRARHGVRAAPSCSRGACARALRGRSGNADGSLRRRRAVELTGVEAVRDRQHGLVGELGRMPQQLLGRLRRVHDDRRGRRQTRRMVQSSSRR